MKIKNMNSIQPHNKVETMLDERPRRQLRCAQRTSVRFGEVSVTPLRG